MKNIFIIDEYISSQKNGIGTFLRELLFCFNNSGNHINLISFNADVDEFCIIEERVIKKYLFPVFKYGHFLEHFKIIKIFLKLYIPDSPNNVFFINHSPCADFIQSLKETHPKSSVVFTIHDFGWTGLLLGSLDAYKRAIKSSSKDTPELKVFHQEKRIYELADKIICLSPDTFNILKSIYKVPEVKISLIPNGLRLQKKANLLNKNDRNKIRIQKNIDVDTKILLFIGRPTAQKGIFEVIHAMKMVLKEFPRTKLAIIGDGNEVSMKGIVNASSQIASSVIITGQLNRAEVEEWLTIADIGVISTYYEQCSYTAIEMMMHGLPIVASDGLGIRNMFVDDVNAKISKIDHRKRPKIFRVNLADNIIHLLKSSDVCQKISDEARNTYNEKYTITEMRKGYKKLIESF
ncbi:MULTISPECIES: glycosyltransferase [unclassified Proteiniphilum]|jgi:glycosyltransferase|uniref:glycosyltransferase n=1 Tax=unclassified Proteiniphilum TaxID=2622718 RepID=UPI00257B2117|nr:MULTISPECIES: glycosyltransferase [unclassified Proteiniphilum]